MAACASLLEPVTSNQKENHAQRRERELTKVTLQKLNCRLRQAPYSYYACSEGALSVAAATF
jgi:hypothetical protein